MAIATYLVSRSPRGGDTRIDTVQAMLLAIDDEVDTDDDSILARAVTVANARGYDVPPDYFDVATAVSTFDAAGDHAVFGSKLSQVIS